MTSASWWQLARGRGARWGVVILWALGAILSYSALRDLAVMLGFPAPLGDLFPLVIDVAVWVGSMNALEARANGRRMIERYAWSLVGGYSLATVAGNALVASTEAVDPRLVRALGDAWAHAVSGVAHAAPAVTMIVFAHLAGLLMDGPRRSDSAIPGSSSAGATPTPDGRAIAPWPAVDGRARSHDPLVDIAVAVTDEGSDLTPELARMTAAEARQAAVRLVRRCRAAGREVTTQDVQRVTGRGVRQARRLLSAASDEVDHSLRPRVLEEGR